MRSPTMVDLLRALQVLQDPSQLHTSLASPPNSFKVPLHAPEREREQPVNSAGDCTAPNRLVSRRLSLAP